MNDSSGELAKLADEGAILIIVGIPSGTEFGIDLISYKIGNMFRGIKMIPPGLHFVYTATSDTQLRMGFLHYFHPNEIVIHEWDNEREKLINYTKNDRHDQISRIRRNRQEIDRFLGQYNYHSMEKWQCLTSDIKEDTVVNVASSMEDKSVDSEVSISPTTTEDDFLEIACDSALKFIPIPPIYRKGAIPAEISFAHIDSIQSIDEYFANFRTAADAIKEIQLSFVLYMCSFSLDALEHWRNLLRFLSNSEAAVEKYTLFYKRYLKILQIHLPELPEEIIAMSTNNTVIRDVGKLLYNCSLGGLKSEAKIIQSELSSTLSWNLEQFQEDPDNMPVIVEL